MAKNIKDEFLKYLKFDPRLKNSRVASYLANPRLVILLLALIIILGLNAFLTLPRNLNPEVKIPIILVSTVLPGAAPADVESLVTVPIEDSISSLENVKTVTSSSQNSVSTLTVEFNSGTDPDRAKSNVQSAVDSVTNLPSDAMAPKVIKLDFENAPIWTFVLTSDSDPGSLAKFAKMLKQKLDDLPEVDSADVSGLEEQEIQITINPQVYATYGINPIQLSQAVSTGLKSFPSGSVRTQSSNFSLVIDPEVVTVDDIRNLRIMLSGQNVALSDIAQIAQGPKPDQNESFIAYPNKKARQAVTFNIRRVKAYNIDRSVAAAKKEVDEDIKTAGGAGVKAVTLINTSDEINKQFSELTRDFLITVSLVVLVLFIFLGPRQALVSSLSAPLSFFITFVIMQRTGITLNFLSLFSLILSLGLLVDDTVVVISAMSFYYKTRRFTPYETGLLVWRDFLAPVFTTTVTTVWAFLPLLLATGIIGEFIKSIPIVVSTALTASFFVAMFITLPLVVIFLKPQFPKRVVIFLKLVFLLAASAVLLVALPKGKLFIIEILAVMGFCFVVIESRREMLTRLGGINILQKGNRFGQILKSAKNKSYEEGVISFEQLNILYRNFIQNILKRQQNRRMVIIMVILFSVFSFILLPLGFVKNEFFPKTDQNTVFISVEFPVGTYINETKKESLLLLEQLKNTKFVNFVSLDLGTKINTQSGGTQSSQNNALFTLNLTDKGKRPESFKIAEDLRNNYANYQNGKLSVVEESGGPPVGADIQIKLLGDDLSILNSKADRVVSYLEKIQGTINVEKSIKPGTGKLVFTPDKAALADRGITVDQLGLWLRLYASGLNFDQNKFPGDDHRTDITLRLTNSSADVSSLDQIIIPTQKEDVPLSSLGSITLSPNPALITREDGKRTISVSAAVRPGFSIADINKGLEKFADSKLDLPDGYTWKTGGVNEENQNSVNSILSAMLLSFMLIIITMVIQFSSFRRAIVVMLVIPLSISGVFVMFALTGTPLSFPALIGVLALFGIVVKNSILLVDKIVENQKLGEMSFIESIGEASASRLEPIALTSIATIFGLIPITLTDPLWRGLGGAVIAGLSFSGVIMLFFIPVVYYIFMNEKNSNFRKK